MKRICFSLFMLIPLFLYCQVNTTVLKALQQNDRIQIKSLLDQGFNINSKDENGATVLMWSIYLSNIETISFLVANGAKVENPEGFLDTKKIDKEKSTKFYSIQSIALSRTNCESTDLLKFITLKLGFSLYINEYNPESGKFDGRTVINLLQNKQRMYSRRGKNYKSISQCPLKDLFLIFGDSLDYALRDKNGIIAKKIEEEKENILDKYRFIYNRLSGGYYVEDFDRSTYFERQTRLNRYKDQLSLLVSKVQNDTTIQDQRTKEIYNTLTAYKGVQFEVNRLVKSTLANDISSQARCQLLSSKLEEVREEIYHLLLNGMGFFEINSADGRLIRLDLNENLKYLEARAKEEFILNEILSHNDLFKNFTLSEQIDNLVNLHQENYKNLQKKLKENEVILEFFEYAELESATKSFAVLIIEKKFKYPKLIHLSHFHELNKDYPSRLFTTSSNKNNRGRPTRAALGYDLQNLYTKLWLPIEDQLQDVEKIFFTLDGMLNKFPFAGFIDDKGRFLCQKYELHQLYSTEILLSDEYFPQSVQNVEEIFLLGGIDYGKEENIVKGDIKKNRNFYRDLLYSPIPYLSGSKREIHSIKKLLETKNENRTISCFEGSHATEFELEKKLTSMNTRKNILHISTHGISLDSPRFCLDEYDNSMVRNSLLLANVANSVEKIGYFDRFDNIWSGYEILNLELDSTVLAVLSACSSGLGYMEAGENPFGLSLAFKTAGVKNLLVSIDKVDDDATREFMEVFYLNLYNSSENNIYHAYRITQEELIKKHPNEPHRWAVFTLIE